MARRTHVRIPFGRYFTPIGDEFASVEALGGLTLLATTIAALVWANVAGGDSYADLWHTELTLGVGDLSITKDLRHWVNDGLMTVFFFVVGLEIKRELIEGDLRDPKTAALPAMAALGGMVVPAALFLALNPSAPGSDGWAIPVATDIAFAVGALSLLGSRVPKGLKLFLLTLAIVDDIGAILVIAIFYSDGISGPWLGGAVSTVLVFFLFQRLGIRHPLVYVLPALVLWACTLESGVHATIAGVILGLLAPNQQWRGQPVIGRLEHVLHPWTSFLVVPLFALANAGVALGADSISDAVSSRVGLGVVLGLVAGKPIGIGLAVGLALLLRLGRLPKGVHARQLIGAGALAGIGFTVSLFIADLSFGGTTQLPGAKLAILTASVASAALGILLLLRRPRNTVST
jgi:Na+:H+ antiporter, NhaA family